MLLATHKFLQDFYILKDVPRKQINFLSPAVLFYFESSAFSFPKTRYQNILDGIIQYTL